VKIEAVIREVETIGHLLAPILADSHKRIVGAALSNLHAQKDKRDKLPKKADKPAWRLVIPPTDPLAFRTTEDVNHRLEVDLACSLSEPNPQGIPTGEHNIAVRVWSKDKGHCFRDEFDAPTLRQLIEAEGRRVMLKFHFDLANKGQEGPRHHLQIGGKAHGADYNWLPDNWKLPRFVHMPVNLVLVCEFLARTFYPSQFKAILEEPTWSYAVKAAEETYLFPFLKTIPYITIHPNRRTDSLLSSVWNG
jgi:hypothetical protein